MPSINFRTGTLFFMEIVRTDILEGMYGVSG